jgi:hypothetical protein
MAQTTSVRPTASAYASAMARPDRETGTSRTTAPLRSASRILAPGFGEAPPWRRDSLSCLCHRRRLQTHPLVRIRARCGSDWQGRRGSTRHFGRERQKNKFLSKCTYVIHKPLVATSSNKETSRNDPFRTARMTPLVTLFVRLVFAKLFWPEASHLRGRRNSISLRPPVADKSLSENRFVIPAVSTESASAFQVS